MKRNIRHKRSRHFQKLKKINEKQLKQCNCQAYTIYATVNFKCSRRGSMWMMVIGNIMSKTLRG